MLLLGLIFLGSFFVVLLIFAYLKINSPDIMTVMTDEEKAAITRLKALKAKTLVVVLKPAKTVLRVV